MPFELGLSVAHEKSSKKRKHEWFVCESMDFRLAKSLSDLNGTDPYIHGGTVGGVFTELRNMFVRSDRQRGQGRIEVHVPKPCIGLSGMVQLRFLSYFAVDEGLTTYDQRKTRTP
jgi:hypothetical protein